MKTSVSWATGEVFNTQAIEIYRLLFDDSLHLVVHGETYNMKFEETRVVHREGMSSLRKCGKMKYPRDQDIQYRDDQVIATNIDMETRRNNV